MLKKINNLLNCMIGAFIGSFIGKAVFEYFEYKKNEEMHILQSAPWYTEVVVYGGITLVILFIIIIVKCIIKRKIK